MTDINVRVGQYAAAKVLTFHGAVAELLTNALDRAGELDWSLTDADEPGRRVTVTATPAGLRELLGFFGFADRTEVKGFAINPKSMRFVHVDSGRVVAVAPVSRARHDPLVE